MVLFSKFEEDENNGQINVTYFLGGNLLDLADRLQLRGANNIGSFKSQEYLQQALTIYQKALKVYQSKKDELGQSIALNKTHIPHVKVYNLRL